MTTAEVILRLLQLTLAVCSPDASGAMDPPCAPETPAPIVKHYESGKSCYVDGKFYENCDDRHNDE